jgi:hypothetical protein
MSGLAHGTYDNGGMCYAACQEAFEWYNSSVFWCQKGCDYGRGRQESPLMRQEADNMCKMIASTNYALAAHEDLNEVPDMRIHATMYSNNATNLYKACVAGIRR